MTQCKGKHALQVIMVAPGDAVADMVKVTRWCPNCGAVVVDAEIDGQIYAGRIARMRFPAAKIAADPDDARTLEFSPVTGEGAQS
jgi:hypothetical protein